MKNFGWTVHRMKSLAILFTVMVFMGCGQDDSSVATEITFKMKFSPPDDISMAEASDVCVDYQVSEISVHLYRTSDDTPIAKEDRIPCEEHHLIISNVPADEKLYMKCMAMGESGAAWEGDVELIELSSNQTNNIGEVFMSYVGDRLIGHWTFDNHTDDETDRYHATLGDGMTDDVYTDNGKIGQALQLDGVDDYVDSAPIDHDFSEFTLSAWVNIPESIQQEWGVIIEYDREGNNWFALSKKLNEPKFRFLWGSVDQEIDSNDISPNTWYHIVCSYNREEDIARIYIDGVVENLRKEARRNEFVKTDDTYLRIGSNQRGEQAMRATIDDVRLYDEALSHTEVKRLYESAPKQ